MKRVLIVLVCIVVVGLLTALSPWGLQQISDQVAHQLAARLAVSVTIDAPRLQWPPTLQVERFHVYDEEKTYVDLQQLELRVVLSALFRRELVIEAVRVAHLYYRDWPAPAMPPATDEPVTAAGDHSLTGPFRRIDLRQFDFPEIIIDVDQTEHPIQLRTAGGLALAPTHVVGVRFDHARVDIGDHATYLLDPLNLTSDNGAYQLDATRIQIGPGQLDMQGRIEPDAIDLRLTLADLPLATFGFAGVPETAGQVEGEWTVKGRPDQPATHLRLAFTGLRPAPTVAWDGPPARFTITADWVDAHFSLRLALEDLTGDPVELAVDLPWSLSLAPFQIEWPPTGDLNGRLTAASDLRELASLLVWDVHRVAGQLAIDLAIGGTASAPQFEGHFTIRDGTYEHDLAGTLIRDLNVRLTGREDALWIEEFRATDGGRGRLRLSGHGQWLPAEDHPFNLHLELDRFRLFHHDTAHATGHGRFDWTGNRLTSELSGGLRLEPVEIHIPERLPPTIIPLDVTEIDGTREHPPPPPSPEPKAAPHELVLNVDLAVPDRFFVRGRGLDAEWGGRVQVRGEPTAPTISGTLNLLRGRFVFFGRRLRLARGTITLDGSFPPNPFLNVVAEARTAGIVALLRMQGPVDAPEIHLDSIPEMPEDEILARLLFGREVARMTPWQAVTMAQAVNQLRGGGSAFDFIGETRRRLGVDQIEIRDRAEDEGDEGMAITVGKYIGDRLYLEVERGLAAEGQRVSAEVEITPTIRLETEMGAEAQAGLDLIWTWDY